MKPSTSRSSNNTSHDSSVKKYRGVQRTPFGRWNSYIWYPYHGRISLGNYATPEKAAHAHDAAVVFIRGFRPEVLRKLNFPNSPPDIPRSVGQPFTKKQVQEIAREYAYRAHVQPALGTGEQSSETEVEEENGNDDPNDKEIARQYANRACTELVQPALGTGEQSNEMEVEEENGNHDPVDKETAREYANRARTEPVQLAMGIGEQPNETEVQEENKKDEPIDKEIAREYANRSRTEPVRPSLVTGEQLNETKVEEENQNDEPIDWSFMDENRNDSYVDWSLVDACASPVLPRQAGLDFSGYDFLPLSDSMPDHQVLDNVKEEEIRLWNFSD